MIGSFLPIQVAVTGNSLEGRRFYSPLVVLAYASLAHLFVATALFGLNLRRRGFRHVGTLTLAVSGAGLATLVRLVLRKHPA